MSQRFRASASYGDWIGTSAADSADRGAIDDFVKKKGLIKHGEVLLGFSMYVGENHGGKVRPPYIYFFFFDREDYENAKAALASMSDPVDLRRVRVDLTIEEFIGLFKLFSISMSLRNILEPDREYNMIDA